MLQLPADRVTDYLERIAAQRPKRPDAAALSDLQVAHLLNVPFENLDIHRGVPIVLDLGAIAEKVIRRRRGGYCYELNSAFGALLATLGYEVTLVAARVAKEGGGFGRAFAHMALIVRAIDRSEPMLVDVGFGDSFTVPMPLSPGDHHADRDRLVRLLWIGRELVYEEDRGDGWHPRYAFTLQPRVLSDFAVMNAWQQSSPESHFTTRTICSMLTAAGRVTIADDRLIVTEGDDRVVHVLNPEEIAAALADRFGIRL